MPAVPAALASISDANQGSQAIRQQNHANNVARLRAALQLRRQARFAGTGNTPAQEARHVAVNGVKRIVSLQPKDMSTNMLEGLCKLSSMTRTHATDAHRLLLAIVNARIASTGLLFSLQIKDVVGAIQKVQEYGVLKRATAAHQHGQQTETTSTTAVRTGPATETAQQPAAAPAGVTMSLTASTGASWAEQAVSVKHLYLTMQRRAMAAQKQTVTVTLTL
ncbi:hypothetical protein LTR78_002844 [Recurvomyces mirabilis]|uniref:Uncharacterized protein n=1 Tax=Recurvomyces mirabilis TaxID=574656 RepID=A0AAE0WSY9_9PEZI|nr:hypothetical protein LTR78_002844 [Recurvomyces mirabilis]KAK5159423.1 hypothetical protein LTS14_002565 [Recurvomyces mirabilis]